MSRRPTKAPRCPGCSINTPRQPHEVAAELRGFTGTWRSVALRYAIGSDPYEAERAADCQVAHSADYALEELALELEGYCRTCAWELASPRLLTRKLAFLAVLGPPPDGRDHRGWEEFELGRVGGDA